ncbi:hypothetical protein FRB99_007326 [Tulasnella sp. 403]|nr:hypothetical protein FRB99_007326 [Tulasnella sp. 403]
MPPYPPPPPPMASLPPPSITHIATTLDEAHNALNIAVTSLDNLRAKIETTEGEISSYSAQVNSLRELIRTKYLEQERYEELLPMALQEKERAETKVKRLEEMLRVVEGNLRAEQWLAEEEADELTRGPMADRFKRYLDEVGRGSVTQQRPTSPVPTDSEFEDLGDLASSTGSVPARPQPVLVNQSFAPEELSALLHNDLRISSPNQSAMPTVAPVLPPLPPLDPSLIDSLASAPASPDYPRLVRELHVLEDATPRMPSPQPLLETGVDSSSSLLSQSLPIPIYVDNLAASHSTDLADLATTSEHGSLSHEQQSSEEREPLGMPSDEQDD